MPDRDKRLPGEQKAPLPPRRLRYRAASILQPALLMPGVAADNFEEMTAGWKQDAAPNSAGLVEIGKRLVLSLRRN